MIVVASLLAFRASAATPTITTQPVSQTNVPGANVSFSVAATGSGTLTYRWSFNGTNLSNSSHIGGATTTTLILTNITALDAGNYRAIVSNNQGSVTSIVAVLTVNAAPTITAQPQGRTVFVGAQYSLSAAASGTPPIAYQWLFNSTPLSNATNTTLLLTNLQLAQSGNYSLQASNVAGLAVSSNASVIVTATPDCASPPSGLVGWWRGEGNVADVTGANNGTLSGSGATYTNGFVGQAFRFDGTNGFVQVPDSASLRPATVTLEAWVWLDPARDTANTESIIFKKNSQIAWFEGYSLAKERHDNGDGNLVDRFVFMVSHNSSQIGIYSTTIAQRGTWYHLAATFDGTTTKLYVNGTLEGTATPGFPLDYDTTPLFIGTTGTWAPYLSMFAGIIDEPTIYNRALSDSEVASIYYAGNIGKCLPPVAPVMVTQPTNQTILAGSSVTFTAVAYGVPAPNYQWYFNGAALTNDARHGGVTSTNLSLMNVQAGDAGNYFVVATNFMGAITSSVAVLTVAMPPSIVSQPQDQTLLAGSEAAFNIATTGSTPMWYQLFLNGVAVPGQYGTGGNSFYFGLGLVQTNQAGTYSILVTNSYGSVTSSNFNLTVLAPVAFTAQPQSQNLYAGATATLSATVTGTQPISYQWLFNGSPLSDATNTTLILTNVQLGQTGTYALQASNLLGAVLSSNANLTVALPPPCVTAASGIVGWWPGNGDTGDLIGGNNGILSSSGASYANGMVEQAFRFDGSSGSLQIPDSAALRPANVTLEVWVWLDPAHPSTSTESIIFKKNTQTAYFEGYSLCKQSINNGNGTYTDRFQFMVSRGTSQVGVSSATVVQRGTWYHVAATFDGTTTKLYVNGALEGTATPGFALDYDTTPVFIGTTGTWAPYLSMFAGIIDEPSIYNRALASNEIAAIYAAGVSGKCVPVYPPSLTAQPASQGVPTNATVSFSVAATGTQPLSYQWYFNNAPLADNGHYAGAATTNLVVANAQPADAGGYYVIVTNFVGSVTSVIANLWVASNPPAIVTQPTNLTANGGGNAVFTATVSGDAPLAFQWYFNGAPLADSAHIIGSASNTLTIVNAQSGDTGNYSLAVTNPVGGVTSSNAALALVLPPNFTTPPVGRSVPPGWPTTFSAAATGDTPITYQWQLNGVDIPDATNTTYAIAAVGAGDLGNYHLVASNAVAVTTSADARLTFGNVAAWGRNISGESLPPPNLTNAFAVAGSLAASFAARPDGTLVSWGSTSTTNISFAATNVVGLASGMNGTAVVRADGSVVVWNSSYLPPTASNAVAVAVGNNFGFALRAEGTLVPWGISPYTNYPAGLNHVIAVACGYAHSLALRSDGTVVAWGNSVDKTPAIIVPGNLTNVVGVAAGFAHSLALKGDGTVVAWGSGISTNLPAGLTNVAAIFCGSYTSQSVNLAVRSNGTVVVWGENNFGEPNPPGALTNLLSVSGAGAVYHAMTIVSDGSPLILQPPVGQKTFVGRDVTLRARAIGAAPLSYQWLWNSNVIAGATNATLTLPSIQAASAGNYQLVVSNALNVAVSLPAPLTVLSNNALTFLDRPASVTNAYQGGRVVMGAAVLGNGPLQYQWFYSTTNTYTPLPGATNDVLVLDPALAAQSGNYYVTVSNQFGGISSFGYPTGNSTPAVVKINFARAWGLTLAVSNPPVVVTNAIAIATGTSSYGHYFALGADGKLRSWSGYSPIYYNETNVAPLSNSFVTAIAAGYQDSLALKSDGTVYAWGYNYYGQTNPPAGLANVTAIACGDYHDLALKSDGTVVGWGQNTYGQATNYAGATNVVALAAGSQHSLALRMDGSVVAWGYNGYGQTIVPAAATNVIALAAGAQHSLALRANGTVVGWGNNSYGQTTIPANATNIVAIAAGGNHSTLLRADGTVISLGYMYQGFASNYVPADLANVIALASGGDHDFGLLGTRAPALATPPFSRSLFRGANTVLAGKVSGVQPVTYQWRFNGADIPGATNDTLALLNLQFTNAGAYQLVAANSYGAITSKVAKVTVTLPLNASLDTSNFVWSTTGAAVWFGQTNVTHDGVDAVQSGGIGALQESILQTTVATNWSGRYTFWWKVSSEAFFDALEFRINGVAQFSISGEQDWQFVSIPVSAATNVLQWRYSKDASGSAGQDTAWVDQFAFVPDPPVITLQPAPASQTVNLGANLNYFIRASGGTLSYQWLQNSNAIGGNSSSLSLNNVGRAQNGNYFVIVNNGGGSVTSSVVSLKVLVPQLLGTPSLAPDGSFTFSSTDANGGLLTPDLLSNFEAQVSTNLTDWQTLVNGLSLTNGLLRLQDTNAADYTSRYYRIVEH